jgi:DNA-binding CsgD family transcriptional regulator
MLTHDLERADSPRTDDERTTRAELAHMLAGEPVSGRLPARLVLADGSAVTVSLEAVLDGDQVAGVLVRLPEPPPGDHAPVGAPAGLSRPGFGWNSLTRAERSVTELAVNGLTNREIASRLFMSRHTVDSHLRHIFQKLQINSRVELVRVAIIETATRPPIVGASAVA